MKQNLRDSRTLTHPPPWRLQGEGFILNYWLKPSFIQRCRHFLQAASPLGRMVQVLLVRYHSSPIGPYDELLILDHPLISKWRLNSIPKIFVSTEASVQHGQQLWGIPKELAEFKWEEQGQETCCTIRFAQQSMQLHLKKSKKPYSFSIRSDRLPKAVLRIRQAWQGKRYQFSPQFHGHLAKLHSAQWTETQDMFPDFSQARYLQSFYVSEFELIFPEAQIQQKKERCFT